MWKTVYKNICKHYHVYSFIANFLSAIGMAGLALLGILTDTMTIAWLVGWGIMFASLLFIGKLLDQEIDDLEKVKEHSNNEYNCDGKG